MKLIKVCSLLMLGTTITSINYASEKAIVKETPKTERRKSFDGVEDYNAGSRITFGFSQQAIQQDTFTRYGQIHPHYGEQREVRIRNAHNYKDFVKNISTIENATTLFEKILPNQPELNFTEEELSNAKTIYTEYYKEKFTQKQKTIATIIAEYLNVTVPARKEENQAIYNSRIEQDRLRTNLRNQENQTVIATIQTLTEESKNLRKKIVTINESVKGQLPLVIKAEDATNLTLKTLDKVLQKYQQQGKK
ncbi:MAG: hypothetical protein ACXWL5_03920 [Candidatus Chromulinivorax sp.]